MSAVAKKPVVMLLREEHVADITLTYKRNPGRPDCLVGMSFLMPASQCCLEVGDAIAFWYPTGPRRYLVHRIAADFPDRWEMRVHVGPDAEEDA